MSNKKRTSFSLAGQALEDLAIIAKLNSRSNANMIEVLIEAEKQDLTAKGKWPVKG